MDKSHRHKAKISKATKTNYHLEPAKGCPCCNGTGRMTMYWPDGTICTKEAFCPHPDTNPTLAKELETLRQARADCG